MTASHDTPHVARIPFALWDADPEQFAKEFGDALRETGFAIITDHALSGELIGEVEILTRKFFELPDPVKQDYADPETHYQRGYSPFGQESAKGRSISDLKEFWHVGRDTIPGLPATPQVKEVSEFDQKTKTLFNDMDALAIELMRAVSIYLGEARHAMDHAINNGNSILRLLHYPPLDTTMPEGAERAAAHEDINLLTLLLGAKESGLQVLHRTGQWMPVNAEPGEVVINVGDMLDRFTAGFLPSTTHRVVNPAPERVTKSRYSMPYFFHPANDFLIDPLPTCVEFCESQGCRPQPPITAENFLNERLCEIGLAKS